MFFSVNAFADTPYGSCSVRKVYTDCAEGYVLQNGECVLESSGSCSAGQYWNGSACTSCPTTHPNSEAGASSESECYKTAELMKNGGSGTCFGKTGTLDGVFTCYYGSTCTLPSWNSSSCNMTNGSKIFQGWSSSDDATTGTTGDFTHGQTYYAVWVTPDCDITNGTGTATTASSNKPRCTVTCNSGYGTSGTYTGSAGATSVSYTCTITSNTCSAGQYWDGSACQECTSGYYCPGGTWTGTGVQGRKSCPDGYGNSEPDSVAAADCYLTTSAGKYVATPESAETTCAENGYCPGGIDVYYGDDGGRMACTANSSSSAGSDEISDCKCNAGYGGNAGVTGGTCTICAAGKYKTSSGNSSCSTCTAGYYCTGGANWTACTANSSSGAGSDDISDCKCNAGYGGNAGVTNGTCTICAAGTYKTGSGNSSCSTCTAGSYCTGGTNQTTCPTGYEDSAPGSDAQSDCYMVVDAGYYLQDPYDTSPYACSRGSSSGQHEVYYGSVSQCSSCAPGSYTPYDGAACSTCPAGSYCTGDGNATRCPALYPNSSAGSDAATDCYTNTLTGQYIATARAEVVTDCQAGTSAGAHTVYYGETSQCNVCKANQWSGDAAGSCQTCPSGWTNDGATAADHAYVSSCKHTVAAGSWYNSDNSTFDTCATGTYSEEHLAGYGVSTSCESCDTGYTNNTDHTACVAITYTVKYNANGATSGSTASSTHTYGVAKALTANGFTRTGYTFAGWATSSSGAVVYNNQQSVTNLTSTQGATVNLYAKWTANTYTVKYNANGATSGSTASSTHTYGVAKALTANGFTRTGYTFAGWATSSSGAVVYNNQQSVTNLTSTQGATVNLYAKWTANTYTVSFDVNGGTGGQTDDVTATYGSQMPTISTTAPTRTGYYFNGWYDAQTGGTRYYNNNGTSARTWDKTADTMLYAQWTANHYFINLNPSPFSTTGTTVVYTIYGTNVYLDSNSSQAMTTSANNITKPTRDGYTFAGYYSGSGGTGTEYINANGYITSAGLSAGKECTSCIWYAKWTAIPYTVSFDANGGTGGQTDDVTATYGSTLPTISTTKPTRPGYTFDGWYDAPTGGTQYYGTAGNSVRTWDKTANATLYAQWTAGNYYIYLNSSGYSTLGTYTLYTTYGTNVYLDSNHSQAMTTSANPITKPTKTGYTFGGYYSESDGTGTEYINANGYITSAGLSAGKECTSASDCKWYVKWIPDCYQITLDNTTNGGTGGTTVLYKTYNSGLWYSDSSCSTQVTTITKPTKTNASYAGHYKSESGGIRYISDSGSLLSGTVTGPITLYAQYNCDANWRGSGTTISGTCTGTQSTVSFDANGGTGGQTASVTATYGSQMPTISTTKPTRTGYTFDGWYDVLETQYYTAAGASARTWDKTANTTLYARWTANTYTVSFNANGGTGGQTASVTATYDSQMPEISTTPPTRTGYTFSGWYDAQTGGNRYYYSTGASARTWDKTANTTLYAQWTAKTYTCSSGQYLNVTSCVTCTAGYYCPSSSVTYTYNGSVQGRTECGGGKYSSAGATSCSNISAGCYGTSASSSCPAVCAANTYSDAGASACTSCDSDYANSGTDAASHAGVASCKVTCAAGTYVASANAACTDVGSGYYTTASQTISQGSTGSRSACSSLNAFYTASDSGRNATTDCYGTTSSGKYVSTAKSGEVTCAAGGYCAGSVKVYYNSTGGRTACGAGKYNASTGSSASSACTNITAGCYGTSASSSCPAVCGDNKYSNAGASACTSCDSDYANSGTDATSHAGVASCKVTCAAGTYVASANAACTDVGSGYYTTASQTISQGSTGSRSACSSLNAFYTASDSGRNATTDCYGTTSSGKYVSTAKSGEVTCAAGGYCAGSVKVYYNSTGGRTACGAGKYNASTGSSASSACTNITAGCYGTSASSSCPAVCAANTYSDAGASSCSSCPTDYKNSGDTAASHAGSASCKITVSGGYYIGTSGDNSSNWDKCACGTYKASHTVAYGSTSSCATTDAGYYAAAGASSQTKATAGYYAAAGACSQTACSGRTKYSAAGAASCSTVSTGYYTTGCNSSSNACTSQTICAKGTYCSSGVAYDCPGGTYGSTTGLSTNACSGKCTAGYYCPAGSTSATQNACATNATSAAGSDAISDCVCKAGYSGDASTSSGTCTACACGYYKGSTGNTSCTKTTAGYYAAGTGNTGQTKATAGNYAAAGACSQSSCADLGGGLYSSSAAGSDATDDCYATVPATKYLSSSTSTSFTTCTAGYYCPGKTLYYASTGGRTACGGGKYSEEGSDDASSDCKTISAGCYGASAASACPNTCAPGSYSTGGASGCTICGNKPTNSSYTDARGNTSADCPWTCNDGYNQTSDNQCGQFCTAGITHIKSSNGLSVPLYSSARTSPAINVKVNDSVCYGSLATGQSSGALNVRVGSTTYHSIN